MNSKGVTSLAVLAAFLAMAFLASDARAGTTQNVSLLYGWNGTNFVPVLTNGSGVLQADINITTSTGINPRTNNTASMGNSLALWANLFARSLRSSSPALSLYAGSTEAITILPNGSVGIGTATPNAQLTINGNLTFTNGPRILDDNGRLKLQAGGAVNGSGGNSSIYFLDSSGTTRGRYDTNAYVAVTYTFTDTSDTDFNTGMYNNTNTSGTGGAANLTLANNINPANTTQTFSTVTSGTTFAVPAGVTVITVKAWGAGGGSGGGSVSGGGGGFAQADIAVTPGESLTVRVGGGGGLGGAGTQRMAGGGGYSGIFRGGTELVIAAGGGGGGGNGPGGPGGGTTGTAGGYTISISCRGGGGTPSAGGAAGTSQDNNAVAGSSLTGGGGGGGDKTYGGAGGTNGGGAGGGQASPIKYGGGGGGGGHFGGGGGDGGTGEACGGGGGSSYTTGTNTVNTAGSGSTAGNTGDADWATPAGNAGTGSDAGNTGRVVIKYTLPTYMTSGNFTSRVFDANQTATWSYIFWYNVSNSSTSILLRTRTSSDNVTFTDWMVHNSSPSAITQNSSNRYLQYQAQLNTTDTSVTPIILNVSVNYTVPASYGTFYLGSTNTVAADLAEYYATGDSSLEAGDVVSLSSVKLVNDTEEVASRGVLRKSSGAYDGKIIGVISTAPGLILGSIDSYGHRDDRLLALAGRTPVKVSSENGAIDIGDYLTSSSAPGVAMRASEPGVVIGRALEPFYSGTQCGDRQCGKIDVFVNAGEGNIFSYMEKQRLQIDKLFAQGRNMLERLAVVEKTLYERQSAEAKVK